MSVNEGTPEPHRPRNAPWLNSPDAPKKPDAAEKKEKLSKLSAHRRELIAEAKELRKFMQRDPASLARDEERNACRQRLNEIDAKRHVMRERRTAQDAEIAKLRKKRREMTERLNSLKAEVGCFQNVEEIDEAKEYLMRKMESSGVGLRGEKHNQMTLKKLDDAKAQFLKLYPLVEAIREVTEQETVLQQEYVAISEQVGIHNKEYDEEMQKKRALDKEAHNGSAERSNLYKKFTEVSTKIDEISLTIDALHADFQKSMTEYDAWYKQAREKYFAKQEEVREQRRREYEERINAHKIAEKKARAVKRQNPYVMEISTCAMLIQYLKQKKVMALQDAEERKKREAAAHFDPSQVAPAGCVVLNESKWADSKPLSKAAKKQQMLQQKQREKASAAAKAKADAAAQSSAENKDRVLHHSEEKIRLFQMIEVEPALSLATIDEKIHQIEEKKKKYEQEIKTGELLLSSSDDEEGEETERHEEVEAADNDDASAAAAAPEKAEAEAVT
ncbi:hypothetical protein ABL78_1298 [Leptomonas seymouri]|uniref:Nuclear segregation protein n=1 Tax=Leptomonas seymouri TaxID=5684 RepID=A0A0N1PD36_LEPSE|nr:hypothetical protein ABL78_1298 [Leptomonas seymouri]|eukprot:KPI89633.1 hypothetical protein ABL78_1298 [Leptomonas seymouri]